jgi:ADP-ribose pyrophosphatase
VCFVTFFVSFVVPYVDSACRVILDRNDDAEEPRRTMADERAEVRARRLVHEGRVFSVSVDTVALPNGHVVDMEVVRHARAVVLVPMPDIHHVVLIRQYRYVVDRWLWELPAGSVEPGEDPEAAAARECHEEIGWLPRRLERLATLLPTPGYCDEEMIFYRLDGLVEPAAPAQGDEDEQIEPRTFTLAEARAMVDRGEIVDMKTVAGLGLV